MRILKFVQKFNFNTKRYVAVINIKLRSRDFEEIEQNAVMKILFSNIF